MKQNRITLRKFIETFPAKSFVKDEEDINLKELSYEEKLKLNLHTYWRLVLSVKDGHIYYAIYRITIHRNGRSFYKTSSVLSYIWIDNESVKLYDVSANFVIEFLNIAGITYFDQYIKSFSFNSSILKGIFCKTIYNEETYYKAVARRIWHINNVSWRNIKKLYDKPNSQFIYKIQDLNAFTKNINDSIERLCSENQPTTLLMDVLSCAIKLNQVVDFKWSEKRLKEEHKKQSQILTQRELDNKDQEPIYKHVICDKNIKLLNTERDIFLEGKEMHHCLYNVYYDRIVNKKHIAFHMYYPEDCTFSVVLDHQNEPYLNQIYRKFDKSVTSETRDVALKFIEDHSDELIEMFNESVKEQKIKKSTELNLFLDQDLPY